MPAARNRGAAGGGIGIGGEGGAASAARRVGAARCPRRVVSNGSQNNDAGRGRARAAGRVGGWRIGRAGPARPHRRAAATGRAGKGGVGLWNNGPAPASPPRWDPRGTSNWANYLPDEEGARAGARDEQHQPSSPDESKAAKESVAVQRLHDMTARIQVQAS